MVPHSSTLAWKIPWTEKPGGLQTTGSLKIRHDWATSLSLFTFMHWRMKWQPTPVFLPGESQRREPGGLPSMGSHRVGHDWSNLAAADSMNYRDTLNRIQWIRVFWVDWQIAVLNREIGVSLIEKLTLEQRFEGGNGVSCSAVWGEWCSKGREESAQNRGQNQHLSAWAQLRLWVRDGGLVRRGGWKGWGGAAQWLRRKIPAGYL